MLLVRHQPATNRVRDQHSGQVTIARAGDTSKDSTTDSGDATARPAAPWEPSEVESGGTDLAAPGLGKTVTLVSIVPVTAPRR